MKCTCKISGFKNSSFLEKIQTYASEEIYDFSNDLHFIEKDFESHKN